MARTIVNQSSEITWDSNFDCSIGTRGEIDITLKGSIANDSLTPPEIIAIIPDNAPNSVVGTWSDILFKGQYFFSRDDSGFVEVRVQYKGTETSESYADDPGGDVPTVRYEVRGVATEVDITSHPDFENYEDSDKQKIAGLLNGDIVANPAYDPLATEGIASWEFVRYVGNPEVPEQVTFNAGSGLNPLEMARRIVRGVKTIYRPSIVASRQWTQQQPLPPSAYASIGTIYTTIPGIGAPADRDWLLVGFTQSSIGNGYYEISADYQLSEPGGIDREIYG